MPAAQIFITITRLVCANCIAVPTIGLADGIIGIFVSVAIAFTFGALVQWLNHALLMQSLNGPAKTSTYFLIIAGIIMSRQRSISK